MNAAVRAQEQAFADELRAAVIDCQRIGGDCRSIRVCVGDVCRALSSRSDAARSGPQSASSVADLPHTDSPR